MKEDLSSQVTQTGALPFNLLHSVYSAIFTLDLKGKITSFNRRAGVIFEVKPNEVIGRHFKEALPEEAGKLIEEVWAETIGEGKVRERLECELLRQDGRMIVFGATTAVLRDEQGKVRGMVVVGQDITGKSMKDLLSELAQMGSFISNLLRDIHSAVLVIDQEGKITVFNHRAEKIFEVKAKEVVGRHFRHSLPKQMTELIKDIWGDVVLRDLTRERLECELFRKDRSIALIGATVAALKDETGEITGMIIVAQDITEKRRMVALEELNKLKSEFVSTVSHELRTPLTSIQGFSELLTVKDYPVKRMKTFAEKINKESERLARLIDSLLDLSRIESGRVTLEKEPVNLRELIENCADTFKPTLAKHNLRLKLEESLPLISADKDKITQVVNNLLSNAIKYSPEGGEVTVRLKAQDQSLVQFSVTDEGIGIAPEHLFRVFERFYRIEGMRKYQITGTGLGLAISKAIVEMHQGKMWVESRVRPEGGKKRGSTFYFTLPTGEVGSRK